MKNYIFQIPKSKYFIYFGVAIICAMGLYEFYTAYNLRSSIEKYPKEFPWMILAAAWRASARSHMVFGVLTFSVGAYLLHDYSRNKDREAVIERLNWTTERIAQLEHGNVKASGNSVDKWPWGSHHTDALGHLEAAANRFWGALYDPSDPTTAPTNEMVAEWLRNERNVSKEKAYAIASILRADGLKTGPRR